ncbi:hypothetical protein LXL04_034015 [Taraxacum kok-saghyz]
MTKHEETQSIPQTLQGEFNGDSNGNKKDQNEKTHKAQDNTLDKNQENASLNEENKTEFYSKISTKLQTLLSTPRQKKQRTIIGEEGEEWRPKTQSINDTFDAVEENSSIEMGAKCQIFYEKGYDPSGSKMGVSLDQS